MAKLAAQALISRLADWGVDTVFGLPGRRHQRDHGGPAPRAGPGPVRPGPPRGGRRVHGHRLRQGDRPARCLPGHLRSRRDPPAQRPVRREARPRRRCWRSPACRRPQCSAPATSRRCTSTGCSTTSPSTTCSSTTRPSCPAWSTSRSAPRYARRGVAHLTIPNDVQVADADADPYQHVAPARPPTTVADLPGAARSGPARRTCEPRRRCSTPAPRWRSWPASARCSAGDEVLAVADALGAPVIKTLPGKAVIPDDSPFAIGGHRAARHQAGRGAGRGLRHAADGRHELPVHQAPARAGHGPSRPDRGRPDPGRRTACRPRSRSSATRGRPSPRCCRCSHRKADRSHLEQVPGAMADWRAEMAALEIADP